MALNIWNCRMKLALMVCQTCLCEALEGAARVVAVQVISESMSCCLRRCFFSSLGLFSLVSTSILRHSYNALDGGWLRVTALAFFFHVPERYHCSKLLATMSFHHNFCSPAARLLPAGVHMRSCLGSQSSAKENKDDAARGWMISSAAFPSCV